MNDFMSHCKLSYKPIKSSEREELQDDLMVGNKRGISGHNVDNFYKVLLVMFVFFYFFSLATFMYSFVYFVGSSKFTSDRYR